MGGTPSTERDWDEKSSHEHPPLSSHSECLSPTVTFPHWRDKTVSTVDPDTGYQLIVLMPGTILFKGTKATASSTVPKRGFYGAFDTAVNYAFRYKEFGGEGEVGKLIGFMVTKPISLLLITWENINLFLSSITNEEEKKTAEWVVNSIFDFYPADHRPLARNSSLPKDLIFSQMLCSKGLQGFAAYRFPIYSERPRTNEEDRKIRFPSEVMLCNSALSSLAPLSVEWRVHPAFPHCIFEASIMTGQPLAIINASQYGGINVPRVRELRTILRNDKFVIAMRELHRTNSLPKWIDSCSCANLGEAPGKNTETFGENELIQQKQIEEEDEEEKAEAAKELEQRRTMRALSSNWDFPPFVIKPLRFLPTLTSLNRDSRKRRRNPENEDEDENENENERKLPKKRTTRVLRRIAKSVEAEELNELFDTFYLPKLTPKMTSQELKQQFTEFTTAFDTSRTIPPPRSLSSFTQFYPSIPLTEGKEQKGTGEGQKEGKAMNERTVLRVVTWNVGGGSSSQQLLELCVNLNADILSLQEVPFAEKSENVLGGRQVKFSLPNDLINAGYPYEYRARVGNSEILLASKLPAIKSFVINLGGSRDEPENVLFNLINGIWIISSQLNSSDESGVTRRLQVSDILELIAQIIVNPGNTGTSRSSTSSSTDSNSTGSAGSAAPIIWLGDFNATRDTDYSVKQLEWLNAHDEAQRLRSLSFPLRSPRPYYGRDVSTIKAVEAAGFADVTDLIGERLGLTTDRADRTDFIFLKNIHPDRITQFFPIITPISSHLPLVLDLIV